MLHHFSQNNPITYRYGFNGHENDNEVKGQGNHYSFSGYCYDPRVARRFQLDPFPSTEISNYAVFENSPITLIDPEGESPISALAKYVAKKGVKAGLKKYAKVHIERRLKKYMSKKMYKQLVKDLDEVMEIMDDEWWETALEFVPVAGDLYGAAAFGTKTAKAWKRMQEIENKYVGKLSKTLKGKERKRFMNNKRANGVRDARKDQRAGVKNGKTYKKGENVDGHHKKSVKDHPDRASDPSNIKFVDRRVHKRYHRIREKLDVKYQNIPEVKVTAPKK